MLGKLNAFFPKSNKEIYNLKSICNRRKGNNVLQFNEFRTIARVCACLYWFLCVSTYMFVRVYFCACLALYLHLCDVYICARLYLCVCACQYICVFVRFYINICVCACLCLCLCVFISVFVHICICDR